MQRTTYMSAQLSSGAVQAAAMLSTARPGLWGTRLAGCPAQQHRCPPAGRLHATALVRKPCMQWRSTTAETLIRTHAYMRTRSCMHTHANTSQFMWGTRLAGCPTQKHRCPPAGRLNATALVRKPWMCSDAANAAVHESHAYAYMHMHACARACTCTRTHKAGRLPHTSAQIPPRPSACHRTGAQALHL